MVIQRRNRRHFVDAGGSAGASDPLVAMGATAVWYADDFLASPRNHIPNRASAAAVAQNLLSAPRRMFNEAIFSRSSVTVADNAVDGPDGVTGAGSTVVWGSVDGFLAAATVTLPAGTYTVAVDVRTTDAATVDFRMGINASLATKTATPSWQSFSHSFTLGSPAATAVFLARALNASTPANLAVCNARIYEGGSDLGVEPIAGHLYFGTNKYDTGAQPTYLDGILTLNAAGKYGLAQLAPASLNTWTVVALAQKKATSGGVIQSTVAETGAFGRLMPCYSINNNQGSAVMYHNGAAAIQETDRLTLWQYKLDDWHVITSRYNAGAAALFMDNAKLFQASVANVSVTVEDLWFATFLGISNYSRYVYHAVAFFPVALTDADVLEAYAHLKSRAAGFSIPVGNPRILALEGDSLTDGGVVSTTPYGSLFGPNSSPAVNGRIFAVSGSTLANITSRAATVDGAIPADKDGKTFILSLLTGRNDLLTFPGGAAAFADAVGVYMLARKAAGWDTTVLCTALPATAGGYNTLRNAYNAIVTGGGWAGDNGVDAICDFAADPTMGPDAAASDALLYPDGTHPSQAGQANLEVIYRAVINGL